MSGSENQARAEEAEEAEEQQSSWYNYSQAETAGREP